MVLMAMIWLYAVNMVVCNGPARHTLKIHRFVFA